MSDQEIYTKTENADKPVGKEGKFIFYKCFIATQ
jgi:hypothetical protein